MQCPICQKEAKPRAENSAFPFCGPRCRQIDLGKWLNEEYRVPVAEEESTESQAGLEPKPEPKKES